MQFVPIDEGSKGIPPNLCVAELDVQPATRFCEPRGKSVFKMNARQDILTLCMWILDF